MNERGVTTAAAEVVDLFKVTPAAARKFDRWHGDPEQQHVVRLVMGHVASAIYRLTPQDVEGVARDTEHAIDDIQWADVKPLTEIADWRPDFAFTHVFHYALEQFGRAYTYQEFRDFCKSDSTARAMLWDPAQHMVASVADERVRAAVAGGADERAARGIRKTVRDAMQWRVGLAYYSFLRELHVLTHLRAAGVDARVHPLADALFRVDAWADRTVLCLFISNARFRASTGGAPAGRKPPAEALLAGASPSFHFVEIELLTTARFGVVQLPEPAQIAEAAARLREAAAGGGLAQGAQGTADPAPDDTL